MKKDTISALLLTQKDLLVNLCKSKVLNTEGCAGMKRAAQTLEEVLSNMTCRSKQKMSLKKTSKKMKFKQAKQQVATLGMRTRSQTNHAKRKVGKKAGKNCVVDEYSSDSDDDE